MGIIPGRIGIASATHDEIIVAGLSFPEIERVGLTGLEILPVNRIGRKVIVPFDNLTLLTLRYSDPIPTGFDDHHTFLSSTVIALGRAYLLFCIRSVAQPTENLPRAESEAFVSAPSLAPLV
jgi:hypothetical protein